MRGSAASLAVALTLLSPGCGNDDGATGAGAASTSEKTASSYPLSARDDPRFATVSAGTGEPPGPAIDPPDRRPPRKLLVRDLEVGAGRAAELGDEVAIRYFAVNYETGEVMLLGWLPSPPSFQLGVSQFGSYLWQKGLVGMRVGGRRELILPAQWASGRDAVDYVVELVRLEPGSEAAPTG